MRPTNESNLDALLERLRVAEDTLRAIRAGEVDALVVESPEGKRVFVLEGADRPYRLFVERMRQGALRLTPEGVILYANPYSAVLFGRSLSEMMNANVLDLLWKGDRERLAEALAAPGSQDVVVRVKTSSTSMVYVQVALSALADRTLTAVLVDLTAERRSRVAIARTELLQKNARLLKRALLAREQAEDTLRVANRRKDDFLATLSHELRNPLASIRYALASFKVEEEDGAPTDMHKARDIIDRQVRQTVRLIDDLMDVSRIAHGRLELRPETFTLDELIHDVRQACGHAVEENGHALHVSVPAGAVHVRADRARMTQVFVNLLTNATKYTPKGGHIELSAEVEAHDLVVTVSDNGVGIPAEKLSEIFEPFSQLDSSMDRTQGGLGIGLALCRQIVTLHGGSIIAFSRGPGCGSRFVSRMPVVINTSEISASDPGPVPDGNGETSPAATRRILIADDNDDAAESLAMLLRTMGHHAVTANDGLEALEFAESGSFDLAMLDIGMPRLNGYELAERIRQQPWGRGLLLVALTGWGQESDRRRAIESGFDGHLTKPVDPDRLTEILARPRQTTAA